MASKYLTTGDIAKMCDVTANGVIKWIKAGKLKAFKTPGGQRRIKEEDFFEFVNHFNYPVDTTKFKQKNHHRVLIVDDDINLLNLLKAYLSQDSSLTILTAKNGYEACIKVGSYQPDLILLDIMMPKVDGYEVYREIRESNLSPMSQIIVLTALNKEIVINRLGPDVPVLSKPVKMEELQQHITLALKPKV